MDSSASPEPILQQVEPLKKELKECKKTKEHLQYSELKYRNLVESANEAILVAQNGIFQYANPKAEALFGYSQKEITSKPLSTFIHKNDCEMVMQRHERRIKGESLAEVCLKWTARERTYSWILLTRLDTLPMLRSDNLFAHSHAPIPRK